MLEIQVLDAQGLVLSRGPVHQFTPPEDVVLELSMEFFQDPHPCMIHRSAVLCRIYGELEECLEKGNGRLPVEELPPSVRAIFHSQPQAACVASVSPEDSPKGKTSPKTPRSFFKGIIRR